MIDKGDFIMIDKGNFIDNFNDNFNDEYVSFIMGIGNNINVYDYKSIFVSVKNKDKMIRILIIFLNIKI